MSDVQLQPVDESWQRGLAVVAHPDDMEYGAAGAVARWTEQGKEIWYLMVTRGQAGINGMQPEDAARVRSEEEQDSARAVGVSAVEFLDFSDGTIEYGLPLRRDIARVIRRRRPEVLLTINFDLTWGGNHLNQADHRAVGLALIDAARDAGNRWIFLELLEEGLDPWPGARTLLVSGSPHPTHAVDITGHLHRAVASLQAHRQYIAGLGSEFDPGAFLRGAAEGTGQRFGTELATSFEVYYL